MLALQLRQFMIVALNPLLNTEDYQIRITSALYRCVAVLPEVLKAQLTRWLSRCVLSRIYA